MNVFEVPRKCNCLIEIHLNFSSSEEYLRVTKKSLLELLPTHSSPYNTVWGWWGYLLLLWAVQRPCRMKNSFLCIIKELWYILQVFCWTLKKKVKNFILWKHLWELKTIFNQYKVIIRSLKETEKYIFLCWYHKSNVYENTTANSKFSVLSGLHSLTTSRKFIPSHDFPHPISNLSLVRIHQ